MKKRIKQGVKRIAAVTLATLLAWTPFVGVLPGTITSTYADDANTFRYSRDAGVASVTIANSATGIPVIFDQDEDDGTFYKDGFTNTEYQCQIALRDGFTLVDNTNINYDMLTVSQEMLDNDASEVDLVIQTKLSAELDITNIMATKVKEISSVTVGDTSLPSIPDGTGGTKYTIPADTLASTPVVITLTTSPAYYGSQDAGYEYMELVVDAAGNQSRKYTYTTTVGDLKNAGGVIDIDGSLNDTEQLLVVNGEVTSNARVTINPSDYGYDDTTVYKPMYEGETCTVVIEPNNGYKVVVLADPEESVVRDNTSLAISYNISKDTTEAPTVEIKLIEPDANVEIAEYLSESEFVISQYLLDNPGNAPNRSLYFALGKNENELCAWSNPVSDFHSGANGPVDIELPLPDASGEYYIYAKFTSITGSSDVVGVRGIGAQPIYIDVTPPEVGYDESYIKIGNNQYGEFASKDKEGTIGTFWINKADIDAGAALSIPVSDNYSKEITYTVEANPTCDGFPKTGSQTSGEAYNGSLEIPLNPVMNGTRLDYYIQDVIGSKENNGVVEKFGNEATGSLDLSNIKYDTQAPTLDNVSFQNEDGTIADTDLVNWQPKAVTMTLAGVENTAGNGTGESVSALQGVYVSINGVKQLMTQSGSTYSHSFDDTGDYVVEIYARDKAGNESEHKEYRIKIDNDGMSNAKITFDPVSNNYGNNYSSEFQVKASADSFCGVKEAQFYFENADGQELCPVITSNVVTDNIVAITAPIEALDGNRNIYVRTVITDQLGRTEEVRTTNPFACNTKGATISVSTSKGSWTNQYVDVQISAIDKTCGVTEVEVYVDGNRVSVTDTNADPNEFTGVIRVDATSGSSAGTKIEVYATNGAYTRVGLPTPAYVYVDKQAPSVGFSGISEGSVSNTSRTLQVSVSDNIWQAMDGVSVTATRTIDGKTTDVDLADMVMTDATTQRGYTFSEDGVYEVTVTATDAAGNTDTKKIGFTIDRTAPVLQITGVTEGDYLGKAANVGFRVVETFYETNRVTIEVERSYRGTTSKKTIPYTSTGVNSLNSSAFGEDGDYTITFSAVDRAGNEATSQTVKFTVDVTAPKVSMSGTKDYAITSENVTLNFQVEENYYETNSVTIQGSCRLADGKTETIRVMGWNNTAIKSAMTETFAKDGYYTITISAKDKAGNSTQETVHFTIDTQAPVIADMSKYDGKYMKNFSLEETLEELISELTVPNVRMTLNGEAYDGRDITEDGKYTLVIEVADEAGLTTTKTVEFVVDNTSPKIILGGVEDKKTYTEPIVMNVALENENDAFVEILINGVAQELTEGKTVYEYVFDVFGDYEVEVRTIDQAGNENTQTFQVTYAEHKTFPWIWVLIPSVVVAAGLVVVLLVRKK